MTTEKEWCKRGSNPKHTAPSPIGMQVIDAIRAGGFRIWNGNCENLNPEDEVELSKLIEKESEFKELMASIQDLYGLITSDGRVKIDENKAHAIALHLIQRHGEK